MSRPFKRLMELEKLFGVDLLPASKKAAPRAPTPGRVEEPSEWSALRKEVTACTRCEELASTRTQVVFGVGSTTAPLMFVGEAPGEDEDRKGEPFVGRAGQLLTATLRKCGVSRSQVYIGNVLKCRPPGNRTPAPQEMIGCMPYLLRQIRLIQPKVLCVLGNVAAKALLNTTLGITKLRGRYHDFQGTKVFAAYHPAYVLRNMNELGTFEEDIRRACVDAGLLR
ncbi:MAG: uracil-DNA glycosylase [Planctomycetes bacterium]|nr:uracil-DNA glycosylase [Planctomycetota bacterium]